MCGIGGASFAPGSKINRRRLATALLTANERRGTDASGYGWVVGDKSDGIYKKDVRGSQLNVGRIPQNATSLIVHTRNGTHGSAKDNDNNHPVLSPSGDIRLIHNGVIWNHDEVRSLFDKTTQKQLPEVDSSVIPAVIEVFGLADTDVIEGDAAVAWFDRETDDTIHLARFSHNPIHFARVLDGSFVFASTAEILYQALSKAGLEWIGNYPAPFESLNEKEYIQIVQGEIVSESHVVWGDHSRASYYSSYRDITSGKVSSGFSNVTKLETPNSNTSKPMALSGSEDSSEYNVYGVEKESVSQPSAVFSSPETDIDDDDYEYWPVNADTGEFMTTAELLDLRDGQTMPVYFSKSHEGDYATYTSLFNMQAALRWYADMSGGGEGVVGPDEGDLRWVNFFCDIGHLSVEGDMEYSWLDPKNVDGIEKLLPPFIKEGLGRLRTLVGA